MLFQYVERLDGRLGLLYDHAGLEQKLPIFGAISPLIDEMWSVQIQHPHVELTLWGNAKNMMGFRVFKDVFSVVLLDAAIQKAESPSPFLGRWPIIQLLVVTISGRQEEICVTVPISTLYCGIEVVDLHREVAAPGHALVLHGVSAPIVEIALQRFERVSPVVPVS